MESSKISFLHYKNSDAIFISQGRLAQLVERLPYKQNVGGSIPSAPTIFPYRKNLAYLKLFSYTSVQ